MADIEMLGGSGFSMNHSSEEGAAQQGSGSGDIEMMGGSDMHLKHTPISCEQKSGGSKGIDMVGEQGMIKSKGVTPYDSDRPSTYGKE